MFYETQDDEQLALAAIKDREAFAVLYRRHLKRVYTYLRSKVSDKAAAED